MKTCTNAGVICSFLFLLEPALATGPRDILAQADHFADLGNWDKARDLYAQAEQGFHAAGDERNELYAKFGRLHRDVESGSYAAVLHQIETDLDNPVVQGDTGLRIRALSLKGTIDLNVNTAGAEDDFSEILAIAKSTGDDKWENRATGELGVVAGVNGDIGKAAVSLLNAISMAAALHDVAAQVNFSVWLANGMTVHGLADRALPILDGALAAASHNPDAGFPLLLYIAKIRALIYLPAKSDGSAGRNEAKGLIEQSLSYARQNNILGAQAELLNQAGLLARDQRSLGEAEKYFSEEAKVAERADLPRMRAEALLHLCELSRQQGHLKQALESIDSAIAEHTRVQEAYDLPMFIAEKAHVEVGLGHLRLADSLYDQATQLVEAMLVNAPSSQIKSSMIATMSDIYLDHFKLAATRFRDSPRAFAVVEAARGRALADSLRYSRSVAATKGAPSAAELEISGIQRIMRQTSMSAAETRRALARLDALYDQLTPVDYSENREEMRRLYRPVSLELLQKALRPGEALIEYVLVGHENSYALEITHDGKRIHELPSRDEIDKLVHSYLSGVKQKKDWAPLARTLFDSVLAPSLSTRPSSIIVVPDGSLHLVPFSALIDENGRYAIQSMTISSAPSATVAYILRTTNQTTSATKPFLGLAFGADSHDGQAPRTEAQRAEIFNGRPLQLPPFPTQSRK